MAVKPSLHAQLGNYLLRVRNTQAAQSNLPNHRDLREAYIRHVDLPSLGFFSGSRVNPEIQHVSGADDADASLGTSETGQVEACGATGNGCGEFWWEAPCVIHAAVASRERHD
jgi:hypothetical protein